MRILIIAQYYSPDVTAAAFRIHETAEGLAALGHEVRVLTTRPHRGIVASLKEIDSGERIRVLRSRVFPLGRGGMARYLAHYLSFLAGATLKGLWLWISGWRADVVWTSSPPLFIVWGGWFLALLNRSPFTLDIRDVWPASAVAAGQIRKGGFPDRFGRWLEAWAYRRAKLITCTAKPMAEYLRKRSSAPVEVVYNGVRTAKGPVEEPTEKSIVYAGNMGLTQRLDTVIRGFGEIKRSGELADWKFVLIGDGAQKAALEALVRDEGMDEWIIFEPLCPKEQVLARLSRVRLLLIHLENHPTLALSIVSKMFDYLSLERPIVAGVEGEGREVLESTGANACFRPNDREDFKSVLLSAVERLDELQQAAPRNREIVIQRFLRKNSVSVLAKAFENYCASSGSKPG